MRALVFSLLLIWPAPSALAAVLPNDTFYGDQVNYLKQVKIPEAWDKTTGSKDVVVAVIDSGVDMDHSELIGNMWFNPGEIPLNGIDDDNNGYVDDSNGWDFLTESSDPHPKPRPGDDFFAVSHGTAVAGIIAATTNNKDGMAGVCWHCKIMALRAVDGTGWGDIKDVGRAIQYAIANHADIINMSFVGELPGAERDKILASVLDQAYRAGVLVVAAVGNDAKDTSAAVGDLDLRPAYPVCFDGGGKKNQILGVGSVDKDNRKSVFSNYGFSCLDINAPGNEVFSLIRHDEAKYSQKYLLDWRGTSFATPIVAGVAGLIKSLNPQLTNDQIMAAITRTGVDISAMNPLYAGKLGAGLLDAAAALNLAGQMEAAPDILITPGAGALAQVLTVDKAGKTNQQWPLFPEAFKGGAKVARADLNGDGHSSFVAGPMSGGPQLRIFNSDGSLLRQWFAGDKKTRVGLKFAVADFNGDGKDEIITATAVKGGTEIKIWDGLGNKLRSFIVSAKDFLNVGDIKVGDVMGDGNPDIVLAGGPGSLPQVGIFDKLGKKQAVWLAYARSFRGGLNLALGDTDGDGHSEIITVPGRGTGVQIKVFSPAGKLNGQFMAFEPEFQGGATVAAGNADADSTIEIIVGSGAGREAEVRIFSKYGSDYNQDGVFSVFVKNFKGGINVGI